jgi:hypothetical protein
MRELFADLESNEKATLQQPRRRPSKRLHLREFRVHLEGRQMQINFLQQCSLMSSII